MRFNATIRQSGSLDKTREQLFEPDVTWHPGAESIHFDFMQNRAELLVTIMKSEQVQSRVLVEARQDLGNGYSDSTSTSTDFHGIARFENLSEGHWDVLVRFPKTGASGGSLHMTAQLSSDTTLMLQRDLDQPEVEVENIVSTRNSHDAEKPVDGEQVSAPLIEEVRGDEAESSTGPS